MGTHTLLRPWAAITFVVLFGAAAVLLLVCLPPADAGASDKTRVTVPKDLIAFDDGDSLAIRWPEGREHVRILGIDTPEIQHLDHDLPHAQAFGDVAAGFLRGCVAVSKEIELLRSGKRDRYGRTLCYVFLDEKNYSVLVIEAQLAYGPNDRYGDNGLPAEHAACKAAALKAGPLAFEEPYLYRRRMRKLTKWMKKNGTYPRLAPSESDK